MLLLFALASRSQPRWQNRMIMLAFLLLWLGGNPWVTKRVVGSLEYQYLPQGELPNAQAIVILGGSTRPATYPRPIVELNEAGDRILYGAWLYKQGKAPHLLLTGGGISWLGGSTPEAERMKSVLTIMEVPEKAIWLESRSRNTEENALYTHEILSQKGINRILLVTSAMHMPRSVLLFERQGFDVIPAPTDFMTENAPPYQGSDFIARLLVDLLPDAHNLHTTTRALKEHLGMLFYKLQGY
ncbi:MAG: YdcF family protein [Ardenticatenaceae bacterium]